MLTNRLKRLIVNEFLHTELSTFSRRTQDVLDRMNVSARAGKEADDRPNILLFNSLTFPVLFRLKSMKRWKELNRHTNRWSVCWSATRTVSSFAAHSTIWTPVATIRLKMSTIRVQFCRLWTRRKKRWKKAMSWPLSKSRQKSMSSSLFLVGSCRSRRVRLPTMTFFKILIFFHSTDKDFMLITLLNPSDESIA